MDGRAATNFSSEKLLTNALLTHSRQVTVLRVIVPKLIGMHSNINNFLAGVNKFA